MISTSNQPDNMGKHDTPTGIGCFAVMPSKEEINEAIIEDARRESAKWDALEKTPVSNEKSYIVEHTPVEPEERTIKSRFEEREERINRIYDENLKDAQQVVSEYLFEKFNIPKGNVTMSYWIDSTSCTDMIVNLVGIHLSEEQLIIVENDIRRDYNLSIFFAPF